MSRNIRFIGILCLSLGATTSAFAMGKAKSSDSVAYQLISIKSLDDTADVTALKNGGYVIANRDGTLIFTDAQGNQTASASVQGSPSHILVMSDGTVVVFDNQGTLSFITSAGQQIASISDWGLAPRDPNHINLPHAEWDTFNRSDIQLDSSGTVVLAISEIDHSIETNTATYHLEDGAKRAVARTFNSKGTKLGELQLDSWSGQLTAMTTQAGFVMTDELGRVYQIGNDLSVKQQLQYLVQNAPNQVSDIVCVGLFADGKMGLGLHSRNELLIYSTDWSQAPIKSAAVGGQISLSSPSCTIAANQTMVINTRNATNFSTSEEATQLIDESGNILSGFLIKGQVIANSGSSDGSFAIAYHPLGGALGLMPTPFLPIPVLPVFSPNELTDKVNFTFFDASGKQVQSMLQAGSPSDNANYTVFLGKSGSNLVVSNGSTGYFVDPTTGTSLGNFPGLNYGKSAIGTDGSVAFVSGGNLILAKLK